MLVGMAPSLIPTLWNIGILHYKQAKLPKHLQHSVSNVASRALRKQPIGKFGSNQMSILNLYSTQVKDNKR